MGKQRSQSMIIYFYLLHATILITFPQHTLACDRILSDERVGPISSSFGSPECGDYNFFLHRETCLKGNKFESSWNLYVDNSKGDCPIEYSVATICDGKCGDGLRFFVVVFNQITLFKFFCIVSLELVDFFWLFINTFILLLLFLG